MKHRHGTRVMFALTLGLLLLMACSPKAEQKTAGMGNTNGNITNMGFSVTDGDWIYFLHQQEEGSLYKMKKNGTEESQIIAEPAMFLNVVDGWIYYVHSTEAKVYRIKPDGTERTLVVDAPSSYLISDGTMLYYLSNAISNEKPEQKIYRCKLDGTEPVLICATPAAQFNLVGDVIYYIGGEDRQIHRIKTDGTGDQVLGATKPGSIIVMGETIFYLNDPQEAKELWSMKTDGTGAVRLSEDEMTTFNVSGDWIWYSHPKDEMMSLEFKKMKLDGSEATLVNEDQPIILNIHGDFLAYLQMDFTTFSIKETFVRVDGSQRKEFTITQAGGGPQEGYSIVQMGEPVKSDDLWIDVKSVYSSNLRLAMDPANDDPNLDEIGNTHLFITFEVTNDSAEAVELYRRVGIIDSDDNSETYIWTGLTDLTDRLDIVETSNYLPQSEYQESLVIPPGETRTIQASGVMDKSISGGIPFGLFSRDQQPVAAINLSINPESFLTPEDARELAVSQISDRTALVPLPLVRAPLEGRDLVFYVFEYQVTPQEKIYLLVDREHGGLYRGELKDGQIIPKERVTP